MSITPAMGSWRQKDYHKLEFSLGWVIRSCLKKTKQRFRKEGGGGERGRGKRRKGRDRGEENISKQTSRFTKGIHYKISTKKF